MKKFKILLPVASLLLIATIAFAEGTATQKSTPAKKKVTQGKLSGKVYISINFLDLGAPANQINSFTIDRAYITYKNKISKQFSFKIRTDVSDKDGWGYEAYIKNAYLQYKDKFSIIGIKAQAGMIGTPILGQTDDLGDMRWITKNFFDNSKAIIGSSIDSSADLGINLSFNLTKYLSLTGAITNGEGYKNVNPTKGMAYYGKLSIIPIKGLYINGFIRYKQTIATTGNSSDFYSGAGILYSSSIIKVGVNYAIVKTAINDINHIVDTWANINLKKLTTISILIMGRFAYGKTVTENNIIGSVGIGYQFNKNLSTLLYYENAIGTHNLYIKTEAKF